VIGSEKCHRRALSFSRPSFWSVCEADESRVRASDATHEIGIQQHQQRGVHTMAIDQVSFYDESLKKQIEGSFISDGKSIHVSSAWHEEFPV
jgi:thymidine kinase